MVNLPDGLRERLQRAMAENPEYVEKYGDPTDENDPRNWLPSKRAEMGISAEDRMRYLELDVEGMQIVVNKLALWQIEQQKKEMLEEMKKDPAGYLRKLMGEYAPEADSQQMVETVNGPIPISQVPGYSSDPSWAPSDEWVEENCTCPDHVARRAAKNPLPVASDDGTYPTGFYL